MMNRTFLLAVLLLLLQTTGKAQEKQPNIIFILADDLGYGDVGFNGQQFILTPNIDRLAAEGIRFNQFYAGTTVCAPSRSALMSGQHTGHTFIRGNLGVEPEGQYPIPDSLFTMAEALKQAGYTTGAFGKWGLGPVNSEGDPNRQGFDHFYGYNCQSLAHRYYPTHLWDNDKKVVLEQNGDLLYNKQYAPDLIQQEALAFIDKNKDEPFFLFLPYILPHAELLVPDDSIFQSYKGKFPEEVFKGDDYGKDARPSGYASQAYPHATFAAMVARLDWYVGQILDQLKTLGIDEQTLIVFSSDNGPHVEGGADPEFFNSGGGLRGFKRDLYEGGIRVPFAARWPSVIQPGQQNDFIGAFWDLFPTFTALAGAEQTQGVDGISIVNALTGKDTQKQHTYLYWEFHEQGGKQAVRYEQWKGIRLKAKEDPGGPIELYDLSRDLQEQQDVAAEHPEIVKVIAQFMEEARTDSEIFPFDN
ncbi:arylsulfatase [Olivibacter sp. SDN3]|uniref:arylsulfatase n=1 Tax=Olivibacter sp. SDN3 TaxID=2764720 RepID=UPI001650D4EC|nr:arylsulfatase [Olivibacter sp. SDN3]QNL48196.1 arylsulfatase [Olivibacter sp. SDN3]